MKKLPLFLLALLPVITGQFITANVNATTFYDNEEWWSPEELASYFVEKNTERELTCQSDVDCHNNILEKLKEEDKKYQVAFKVFIESRFIISSINRGNNTVGIYFNNDDVNISKYNPGWRDSDLLTLFLGWYDDQSLIYELTDNNLSQPEENRHTLYAKTYKEMGLGWLPSQTFYSIELDEPIGETSFISFFAHSSIFFTRGTIDLSTCAEDPNWGSCDLLISKEGEMRYFGPSDQGIIGPEVPPDVEPGGEPTDEPVEEPAEDPVLVIPDPTINPEPVAPITTSHGKTDLGSSQTLNTLAISQPSSVKENPETKESTLESAPNDDVIDIPLTGKTLSMTPSKCNKNSFPWWFMIMILVGDIIAVWIFMPNRHQRIK